MIVESPSGAGIAVFGLEADTDEEQSTLLLE